MRKLEMEETFSNPLKYFILVRDKFLFEYELETIYIRWWIVLLLQENIYLRSSLSVKSFVGDWPRNAKSC